MYGIELTARSLRCVDAIGALAHQDVLAGIDRALAAVLRAWRAILCRVAVL